MNKKWLVLILTLSLIATIFFIPVPIRGLRYSNDTNLSSVDASFIGEAIGDNSGYSVALINDVNGDGFDDLLISAPTGGIPANAGHTYLILGKPSNWIMDDSVTNAAASFVGENEYDFSGWPVADNGDVNGDGYDDILLGAQYNDEGGGIPSTQNDGAGQLKTAV